MTFLRYLLTFMALTASALFISSHGFAIQIQPQNTTITTKDSVILQGDIFAPSKAASPKKIVLLLHMLGHNRKDYETLVSPLTSVGFEVVTVDLRGHGQSTKKTDGSTVNYKNFDVADWAKLPGDIEKLVDQINEKNGSKIYIVGASIGANTAALVAAKKASVNGVVLLSPGLDFRGLKPASALSEFKGPVLIVASAEDKYSAESANSFHSIDSKRIALKNLNNAGHGTDMLSNDKDLVKTIVDWLKKQANIK